jgi:hypothetical protein
VSAYTVRRNWKVLLDRPFFEYLARATPSRAKCLRGAIVKLQQGDIDVIKVQFDIDPSVYSVWACDVIIVAACHDSTIVLADVLLPPPNAL